MRNYDASIDFAGQKRLDLHIAGGLAQLQLHVRPHVTKVPQHGGQDAVVSRADEGQRQRTDFPARQALGQRR